MYLTQYGTRFEVLHCLRLSFITCRLYISLWWTFWLHYLFFFWYVLVRWLSIVWKYSTDRNGCWVGFLSLTPSFLLRWNKKIGKIVMVHLQLLIDEDEARGEQDNMLIYFKKQKKRKYFSSYENSQFLPLLGSPGNVKF